MNDDFLRDLGAAWRDGGGDAPAPVRRRVLRDLWLARAVLAAEMTAAVGGIAGGLWIAVIGLYRHSPLFLLSAAVLLLSLPPLAILSWLARRDSLRWEDMTPEGVVDYALRRLDRSARLVRLTRWHLYVLTAFLAGIAVLVATGLAALDRFVLAYSALVAAIIVVGLARLRRRSRRIAAERAQCERLRAELAEAGQPD
jgi:hypothetical protein